MVKGSRFRSAFHNPPPPLTGAIDFTDTVSLTQQAHKDSCDINLIVARCNAGGVLTHVNSRQPAFLDLTLYPPDYQSALDRVIEANNAFSLLPARVRERFNNNPAELLNFVSDLDNRDEAVKLGLIEVPKQDAQKVAEQPSST